ncbi:MAG TPA: GNAT family N-acetyltransferase [Nocardioides sp.]|jgi:RimJ/RimL family protein N-acetyltransferase|nr:GNAT family N-acetyltransferase [Nocardioides sp.]
MTGAHTHTDGPAAYRIVLAGHLDDHWSDWLGGAALVRHDDGTTSVTAEVVDQAQLFGLLGAVRDMGATLVSLRHDSRPAVVPALDRALATDRLTLRPATAEDADATWAYRRLDSVNEWLTGSPTTLEEYRRLFGDPSRLATTVVVETSGANGRATRIIGDFMLRREDAWAQAEVAERARGTQAELGWVLDPAHTGVGYATEAVRELLRYCFEDLGVRRVVANCFLGNDASWRLMERLGMRRETHAVAESLHRTGGWLDTVAYALLVEEWREWRL